MVWRYFLVSIQQHTNNTPIILSKKDKKFEGYYKLARHYRWGLNQIFRKFNYSAAIIVEGGSLFPVPSYVDGFMFS